MVVRPTTVRGRQEVLPSWNRTDVRAALLDFVERVSTPGQPGFVPESERIAVFDNDGTLWCEQPAMVQLFFAMDRLEQLAQEDEQLRELQPYRAFLEQDVATIATFGKREALEFAARTHAGVSPEEFAELAGAWLARARHPTLHRLFTECVYQPQLELLELLRERGFKVFLCSGGGTEFLRCFADRVYGISPECVIGSSHRLKVKLHEGHISLFKLGELRSFNDREEKVINLELHLGRPPLLAFGNSDGDLRMLQYTTSKRSDSLVLLLHHDDAQREFAYDRDYRLSPLDEAMQEARERGWQVVSMKQDWRTVFPARRAGPAAPELAGLAANTSWTVN